MAGSRVYGPEQEFTWRLRSRLPMDIGFSFSHEQLQALRSAFGTRFESRHTLDMRGRVYLPWSRYYIVVQFGRDRRAEGRDAYVTSRVRTWLDTALCAIGVSGGVAALVWLAMQAF